MALRTTLAALVLAALLAVPGVCLAGFCDGKMNGYWCDGDTLTLCKNGSAASQQGCDCGCKSMPVGTDDLCNPCGSGFCADKINGYWCDGDTLTLCKNGSAASQQGCDCGCKSMPLGTDDECQTCSSGFCSGKVNGYWCDGDTLKLCKDGAEASSQGCECGCKSMPEGTDDVCNGCASGFCADKTGGYWCDGDTLKLCQGGAEASAEQCPYGCKSMPEGTDDQCESKPEDPIEPGGFCSGKADGPWCDADTLVTCQSGKEAGSTFCEFGCLPQPEGVADKCGAPPVVEGFCAGKTDGLWCNQQELVVCSGGTQASQTTCEFGCLPQPPGVDDKCATPPGAPDFCATKADGHWCDGASLTLCEGGLTGSAIACPFGCQWDPVTMNAFCNAKPGEEPVEGALSVSNVNGCGLFSGSVNLWDGSGLPVWDQTDHPDDTLGTCTGLTIGNSGCTITTLAMLYEFLGVQRELPSGETGNGPVIEDAWRSQSAGGHTMGYAGGSYTIGGKEKWGECLVIWARNPVGVSLQQHHNPSASCVSYQSALVIANSLNSGRPVVAGVHWVAGAQDQHWVLVIGADEQGLVINDPWHGLAGARLNDNDLGTYVIDTFFTPYGDGVGSGDEASGVYDEQGTRIPDEEAVSPVPLIVAGDGGTGEDTVEEYTTACGLAVFPGSPWIPFLFGLLLLAAARASGGYGRTHTPRSGPGSGGRHAA